MRMKYIQCVLLLSIIVFNPCILGKTSRNGNNAPVKTTENTQEPTTTVNTDTHKDGATPTPVEGNHVDTQTPSVKEPGKHLRINLITSLMEMEDDDDRNKQAKELVNLLNGLLQVWEGTNQSPTPTSTTQSSGSIVNTTSPTTATSTTATSTTATATSTTVTTNTTPPTGIIAAITHTKATETDTILFEPVTPIRVAEETKHFYKSSAFSFLLFCTLFAVFALFFCYVSRRKIKVYFYKNFSSGRSGKGYTRAPTLEDAMPSFTDVKD